MCKKKRELTFSNLCPAVLSSKPFTTEQAFQNVICKTFNRPLAETAVKIWNFIEPGQNGTKYRKGYYMNSLKIHPKRPSNTITKICAGTGGMMHYAEKRSLTIEELKRLGSFPDAYSFIGKFDQQWERIGNSVPPLLMRAIVLTISSHLFS